MQVLLHLNASSLGLYIKWIGFILCRNCAWFIYVRDESTLENLFDYYCQVGAVANFLWYRWMGERTSGNDYWSCCQMEMKANESEKQPKRAQWAQCGRDGSGGWVLALSANLWARQGRSTKSKRKAREWERDKESQRIGQGWQKKKQKENQSKRQTVWARDCAP